MNEINSTDSVPVEADFLTSDQLKFLEAERDKLTVTEQFINSVIAKDGFEEVINKAIIEGKIFSPSQFQSLQEKFRALDDKDSDRIDLTETLVNGAGDKIIMSARLQSLLGFLTDGVMVKDELDELVRALKGDNVPDADIDRVKTALDNTGSVFLQRGVFIPLKSLLEDSLGRKLTIAPEGASGYTEVPVPDFSLPATEPVAPANDAPTPKAQMPNISQPVELPISFIEFLKNTDKEYDRVEHEVMNDQQFQDFFANLKSHFAYYKTLTDEKMAWEVIVRPQLWVKLSPRTRAWVQNLVTRNQDSFLAKVEQIAKASHISQLEELKKTLIK